MPVNTITSCQKAYAILKDQLVLSEERFMDACNIAAAACSDANPITTPSTVAGHTACITWVAAVGGWLNTPDTQAHLKPYNFGFIPAREEPYLTLIHLADFAQHYRLENVHPRIQTVCGQIASDIYQRNNRCGSEHNIEKVCRSVAYIKCQAPLPRDTPSRTDQSFATIDCVRKLVEDPTTSLYDISAQVYYRLPPSEYICEGPGRLHPNDGMKLPEPSTATCVNPPAPPRDFGPTLELQTAILTGVHGQTEQAALGTGIHLKTVLVTTGVTGSRHNDGVSDPTWSGGIYIGSNWTFWQPAPSVAFALNVRGVLEMNRTALYPAAQAGAGVAFPELVGRYLVPQINVGYGLQGTKTSDAIQWLHTVMVAFNLTSRF